MKHQTVLNVNLKSRYTNEKNAENIPRNAFLFYCTNKIGDDTLLFSRTESRQLSGAVKTIQPAAQANLIRYTWNTNQVA